MDRRGLLTYYAEIGRAVLCDDGDRDRVRGGIFLLAENGGGIAEAGRVEQECGASLHAGPVLSALGAGGELVGCRDRPVFRALGYGDGGIIQASLSGAGIARCFPECSGAGRSRCRTCSGGGSRFRCSARPLPLPRMGSMRRSCSGPPPA